VARFADCHGLPVVIKAAHGGGGRGMRVARTYLEIPDLYESAVREAAGSFGRGECLVERYLERCRHVETQCLADSHGTVVVVSTRDCSLQRRHQKLVEEAPAPFLTGQQRTLLTDVSSAIMREVGYVGAGTCEFLVGADGSVAFLEVNARLQVEHPVTEEVTGIDLVREMLRIADGQALGCSDPDVRGHAIEFRINAEDPGRDFLPGPGTVRWRLPSGPGVRLDAGVEDGTVVGQAFDSLLAKLVIRGASRAEALERARRALDEFQVHGIPTVLPFHRAVVRDPAFAPADPAQPFEVHTRWIETEFENRVPTWQPESDMAVAHSPPLRERVTVEVNSRRFEVTLPAARRAPAARGDRAGWRPPRRGPAPTPTGEALTSPINGTVVSLAVADGAAVRTGDLVVVLEAMKMEQRLLAHRSGTVRDLSVAVGSQVSAGSSICRIAN
jgi:acetyl-CoA/propionyl-CoA carboxylase biotin carboxyl carrier protein